MKKAPLRPTNLQKLQKPVGLTRKPTKPETLPIVDQILILKARFLQIEICLENVRNDEELEEKKRKVHGSLCKLINLDNLINEYATKINEKTVYEHQKNMIDEMRKLMALFGGDQSQSQIDADLTPFDRFRQDHEKFEKYLQKKAYQVYLKVCEATQGVLLKSFEEAAVKSEKTKRDLQEMHEINTDDLEDIKIKSIANLENLTQIDNQNRAVWDQASKELDFMYKSLSDLLLKAEI